MFNRQFTAYGTQEGKENLKAEVVEKTKYLDVKMGHYTFIPQSESHDLQGFSTTNICECVCGFIKGKEGVAFFHFDKCKDAADLAKMISRDFPSKKISITLIGGNMNNCWQPSTYVDCSIQLSRLSIKSFNAVYGANIKEPNDDQSAFQLMHQLIMPNTKSKVRHANRRFRLNEIEKAILQLNNDAFIFEYDYPGLDERLQKASCTAEYFLDSDENTFIVRGIVDAHGYQNISDVLSSLDKEGVLKHSSLQHFNCKIAANIVVDFSGKITELNKHLHDVISDHKSAQKLKKRTHYQFDFSSHEAYLPQHLKQYSALKVHSAFFSEKTENQPQSVDSKTPLSSSKNENERTCGNCRIL